mgnify:FL=1
MNKTVHATRPFAIGAALLGLALSPLAGAAQSDLDASEASAFMGIWLVSMDTEFGAFNLELTIEDQGGKVAATMGSPDLGPETQSIIDITKSDESLVMVQEIDAQGQFLEIEMTLERDGEDLSVYFDVDGGMFAASGIGTRQDN